MPDPDTFTLASELLDAENAESSQNSKAPRVALSKALQTINSQYINPVNNISEEGKITGITPLPKHRWQIHLHNEVDQYQWPAPPRMIITGELSNRDGTSELGGRDRLNRALTDKMIRATTRWELVLKPNLTDMQLLEIETKGKQELWIDLEKKRLGCILWLATI